MDNPEKLATLDTQDNPEKLATFGYTKRRQPKQKTQHNKCWTPLYKNKHK